jgi:hypothetical protein
VLLDHGRVVIDEDVSLIGMERQLKPYQNIRSTRTTFDIAASIVGLSSDIRPVTAVALTTEKVGGYLRWGF